jgi:hypothetical protein
MNPAGLEAYMAGKADLVNSIADTVEPQYMQEIPKQDGWKVPESYADGSLSLALSGSTSDEGTAKAGSGTGGPPPS